MQARDEEAGCELDEKHDDGNGGVWRTNDNKSGSASYPKAIQLPPTVSMSPNPSNNTRNPRHPLRLFVVDPDLSHPVSTSQH